ncbi:hypothetical protein Pd630_LPD09101 (plasmid) [Rhodococcus opacus PD630]|nr:hypothetical protein [Rhodococcus opacus]AHK35341.1 hypothetical protein Pd630_LPD09101 [Rhodococcus opacus PD630]
MSIDHHGQHPGDNELALDTTETAILDTFLRALTLHTAADAITPNESVMSAAARMRHDRRVREENHSRPR